MLEPYSSFPVFSDKVNKYWLTDRDRPHPGQYRIVVDRELPPSRSVMLLDPIGSGGFLSMLPEMARRTGLNPGSEADKQTIFEAMQLAGIELNGADHLFYFSNEQQKLLHNESFPAAVRQLTSEDADAFEDFVSEAPEDDMDEAFVELDHWLAFGCFVEDRLVSAASMYTWSGTSFADLGVITLPQFRGQGFGKQTVRAIGAQALRLGCEPQYRCQPDNVSSIRLAQASGFSPFATWDVIKPDED